MLRKLLSHAAIYGLAAQVPRLAGVLALPVVTPYLTPDDYGVAGVVMAVASGLGFLQYLGLGVVMVNSFVKYPLRYTWIWRQINGFTTLWTLVFGLLLGIILYFVVPSGAHENRLQIALLFAVPVMLFTSADIHANLFCQLSMRPLPIAIKTFIVGCLGVVLNVFFIRYMRLGYMGWFYANFVGAAAGFLISAYIVYVRQKLWPILNFKWYRIKGALRVALPVLPHSMSFFLLDTSDRLVMTALRVPIPSIGLYNVASNFGSYFQAASGALVQAATPLYVENYGRTGDLKAALEVRRVTFFLQILFLGVTSLVSLWMKEIFEILIRNEELQQAYPLAIIILMGYNARPMYLAAINLLAVQEHTSKLWKVSFVAGAGNVVLNFLLIPVYGFQAAAFTTFAALMYMGYSGYFLKEYKQLTLVKYYPVLWLCITVVMLGVVFELSVFGQLYKAFFSVVLALAMLVGTFVIKHQHQHSAFKL
ncbi:lipopolysaccharide biosynthesis protein [Botryobacter ruber]|uniref:lipopolysaccharide biosynthesis protein n=1 Tax=Botryobacter ruber TaxID=2171629 RepID=UPI000F6499C8|nr:oligosaccharide flippase family protein [Botryobacter ruber]